MTTAIPRPPLTPAYTLTLAALLTAGITTGPAHAQQRTLGIIGDSISQATHSDDDCEGDDIIRCLDERLLKPDGPFSFVSSEQSYSIRTTLGMSRVIDHSRNGARWDDALGQAESIIDSAADDGLSVDAVFILLGGNDVCRGQGETPTELATVEAHIDETLTHLTSTLPAGAAVYVADVPDIVPLRNLMKDYSDNLVFENCQGTWDVDLEAISDDAIEEACEAISGSICNGFGSSPFLSAARKLIEETLKAGAGDNVTTLGGSCGNILSSDATAQERALAATYNEELVALIETRVEAFDGRNQISVQFVSGLYEVELLESDLSKIDCFHPSRSGQARIGGILGETLAELVAERARRSAGGVVPILDLLLDDTPSSPAPASEGR